jgi:hypothetical protein
MIGAHASPDQMGNSQHVYEVRPRKDKRGVKQKAFSKRCVHDPLQPTLQSAQAFPLSGAGHRAHTVTDWEANFSGNHTQAPNACGLLAIPPR